MGRSIFILFHFSVSRSCFSRSCTWSNRISLDCLRYQWSGAVDATGALARFRVPAAIAVNAADNLYVADTGNHSI